MSFTQATYTAATGQRIEIVHGNITRECSDAIVNAANSYLVHGGGVAGAISRAGGPTIQDESDAWIEATGELRNGQVAVTGAGRLPCKHVIHAVGPIWRGGDMNEEAELGEAMRNSLERADDLSLNSISVPAISSGIFGFPKNLCAEILISETLRFFARRPGSTLVVVRLTNFDEPTVGVFIEALETLTSQSPAP